MRPRLFLPDLFYVTLGAQVVPLTGSNLNKYHNSDKLMVRFLSSAALFSFTSEQGRR